MKTIETIARGRGNNFDFIRFIAASAVILGHAYPLTGVPSPFLIKPGYDIGGAAVTVFFAISGLLIVKSYVRTPSVFDFATARFMRLMPGLAVVLMLSALVLGPAVSNLAPTDYFSRRDTWSYIGHNLALWKLHYFLPGVFETNPYPRAVNGSIWTLPYEVSCYIVVALVGAIGLVKARRALMFLFAYIVVYCLLRNDWNAPAAHWAQFSLPFLIGAAFFVWRTAIPLNFALSALIAGTAYVLRNSPIAYELLSLAIVYGAFWLASVPSSKLHNFGKYGDFSYGIYIYGFAVEQTIIWARHGLTPAVLAAATFAGTLPLAVLSWHFVEKPALDHRHSLGRRLAAFARPGNRRRAADPPDPGATETAPLL